MIAARRQQAFTLLELLVALAVFAVVAALAYTSFNGVLRWRAGIESQSDGLARLQFAIEMIERDLTSIVRRPVRGPFGDELPELLLTPTRVEWVRGGRAGFRQQRTALERVHYESDGRQLVRIGWPQLDRSPATEPQVVTLLEDVSNVRFRVLWEGQWQARWPLPSLTELAWPRAVEVTLETAQWGTVRRVIELPAANWTPVIGN